MKTFHTIVLTIGAVALGVLLWEMDPATVGRLVLHVGWGMALIIAQQIVAHVLNALAWRFAFAADSAASFPLIELIQLRVVGDAINYLTPSGTIAGEVTRTTRLNASQGMEVRAASVLVAKCTQTLGQILFALTGFIVAGAPLLVARYDELVLYGLASGLALGLATVALYAVSTRRRPGSGVTVAPSQTGLRALGGWLRYFFRRHPGRFVISTLLFLLAYAWGTFEAYWICYFLGIPVSIGTALTIEALSTALDGLLFMVPARMGTQEGGKTAIFAALGLSPSSGFAFGVVRHVRELVWAGLGLWLGLRSTKPARGPLGVGRRRAGECSPPPRDEAIRAEPADTRGG